MDKLDSKYGMYDQNVMDAFDALDTRMKYRALSTPGLAIGSGSAKKVKIANTTIYLLNGVFTSATTSEITFTATSMDITASASTVQEAMYLVCFTTLGGVAAGTPVLVMGDIATGSGNAVLPEVPAGYTPIGAVRIAVAAGATSFDASSDDLSAGHLTDTYYNYGWITPRFDAIV